MSVITQLSEAVSNQIAAGEVVERPASVVKELLENSIDAGASRILVEIEEGGVELIRISDDGVGMDRQDAELCLSRHATSKIQDVHDLETIASLGFRGEALPSIASVSQFTITTHSATTDEGTRVIVLGGKTQSITDYGAAPGTVIEVKDLFYNVPARRKFLKRPATEVSHINDIVSRIALAHPQIAIRLKNGKRVTMDIPSEQARDPKGRLARILGDKVSQHLYRIEETELGQQVRVTGWCGAPQLSERTTRGLHCFVNGRFVRDRTIQHAIQDAYRTMMERGRHPIVVLRLDIDPSVVDVNVHPQKTEVRFSDSGTVHRAVTRALGRCLANQAWAKDLVYSDSLGKNGVPSWTSDTAGSVPNPQARPSNWSAPSQGSGSRLPNATPDGTAQDQWEYVPSSEPSQIEIQSDRGIFASLEPIGQIMSTYLVCQGPDKMVLIDQHAAHERIAFQQMMTQHQKGSLEVQPLLFPQALDLDQNRQSVAKNSLELIEKCGFGLEEKAEGKWFLKTVPAILAGRNLVQVLVDVIDEIESMNTTTPMDEMLESLFSCAACHTVVRAGDNLSKEEISSLLKQMDEIDFGTLCPHGRPVYSEWSSEDLAKIFHRK